MWEKIKEMRENIKPKSQKATTTTEIKPLSHFDNAKASVPTAPAIKVPEITHEESPVIEKDAMYQENDNSIEIN